MGYNKWILAIVYIFDEVAIFDDTKIKFEISLTGAVSYI